MMLSSPKSASSPTSPGSQAQRFFSQGKRIPKDVKRHCGMCKQHGLLVETRGHTCGYKSCQCEQCELVRKRREIMSTQIRLRREQDKKFQRTTDASEADIVPWTGEIGEAKQIPDNINMCYFCQKCKNHGILMWKKDHKKKCQFTDCRCEQCDLIDSRRALDRHIKKRKLSDTGTLKAESVGSKSPRKEECSSEESSSSDSSSLCGGNLLTVPTIFKRSTSSLEAPISPTTAPVTPLNFPLPLPMFPIFPQAPLLNFNPYAAFLGSNQQFFFDMQMLFQNLNCLNEMAMRNSE
ncbi:unnamed protein product [Caenorhabditis angaria]|uniref:DM domain-containing protein n=1 Tax=Caenorhabditis angaria TaxID=860376 RepID=A0A9P1N6U7_9PELO|nr:unnamed protein product [Caenorhabditis angaria]